MSNFIGSIAADFSASEALAFTSYSKTYQEMNPKVVLQVPVRENQIPFLSLMNIGLLLLVVKAFFTVTLSAFRTAGMFKDIVILEGETELVAWIIAFLVIGAVEVGIVIYAIYGAYQKHLEGNEGTRSSDGLWIMLSVFLALILMIGANAMKSLPVITEGDAIIVRTLIERILLIAMGIGVPSMAVIDGHFIGNSMGAWLVRNQGIEKRYLAAIDDNNIQQLEVDADYFASLRASWEESAQYKSLSLQYRKVQAQARKGDTPPAAIQSGPGAPTKIEMTLEWLKKNDPGWSALADVPSARDLRPRLQAHYGIEFPLSSIQKARARHMEK